MQESESFRAGRNARILCFDSKNKIRGSVQNKHARARVDRTGARVYEWTRYNYTVTVLHFSSPRINILFYYYYRAVLYARDGPFENSSGGDGAALASRTDIRKVYGSLLWATA